MTAPRAIDVFSGCGGLTSGLKLAGFSVVGAVDCDPVAAKTYQINHPEVYVWSADVEALSIGEVLHTLGLGVEELDLLAGCPPCRGFSSLRTLNGAARNRDPKNRLIDQMLRLIEGLKPKTVMLENVPGMAKASRFRRFERSLRNLGYKVDWAIRDARKFGVPQRRRRLILLAGRGFAVPFATESEAALTVHETIGSLPRAGKSGDPLHDMPENRSERIVKLIRDIPKNGGSRLDLPSSRQLTCHRNFDGFKDVYGRMAWDDVAPTITSGCFNPSKGRFLHPEENRAITLREASLLQGFPQSYEFPISAGKSKLAWLIGNALPPEFVRRHALKIRDALATSRGPLRI